MVSDIISFLKFIFDPETLSTLSAISGFASRRQKNWRGKTRTLTAKFLGEEPYKVNAFANYLLNELETIGQTKDEIKKFEIVFTELVRNAFEHGCKQSNKCRVTIRCTYSRWFVRLEVSDSGKGFDLIKALSEQANNKGLQVVEKLTFRFKSNKSGNSLTVFLVGSDSVQTKTSIEKFKGKEILFITIRNREEWYYMTEDWEPLKRIVDDSPQDLVIIDCREVNWISVQLTEFERTVNGFSSKERKYYALLIALRQVSYLDFTNLISETFRIFDRDQVEKAKQWLYDQSTRLPKFKEKRP